MSQRVDGLAGGRQNPDCAPDSSATESAISQLQSLKLQAMFMRLAVASSPLIASHPFEESWCE